VYEVTERSALTAVSGLGSKIDRLRSRGYRIAVDDLGAGYASLSSFIHIEPDFVKLDMSLVRDVHMSSRKRSLVRGIHQICARDLNIQVICEGVEKPEERDTLIAEGLDLLQGYYFGRPEDGIRPPTFTETKKVAV
jgi:EAL domain-containing protein (putative c-di-GMP-specific phosphodiesterase class I)